MAGAVTFSETAERAVAPLISCPPIVGRRGRYTCGMADGKQQSIGAALVVPQSLVENHRAFLQYLERRVGDRALAEDILQDAFVRSVGAAEGLDNDTVVRWF